MIDAWLLFTVFLPSLLSETNLPLQAFSQVLAVVAGSVAGALNVLLPCISQLLQASGIQGEHRLFLGCTKDNLKYGRSRCCHLVVSSKPETVGREPCFSSLDSSFG